MPGGEPYGLMVIDHAVRHRAAPGATTDDVGALAQLSAVAAAAFMPVVLSLDPRALEVDEFSDLEGVRDVTAPLRDAEHVRWRSLAGRADMRFVAVTLPRLLARHPWTDDPSRVDGFRYSEYAPDRGQPRVDERRLRLCRLRRPRLRRKQLAGRRARRGDRPGRRRSRHQPCRRAVRQRSCPCLAAPRRRIPVQPSPGTRAGRGRPDAGRRAAVRTRHGVRRVAQHAGAGQLFGRHRRRGRGECPAFRADQLDAVRLPFRPPPQGDGPRHGGILPHRRRDRATAQSLAPGLRQHQHQQHERIAGAFPAGRRQCAGARAAGKARRRSAAPFTCGRTTSSTTSPPPSTS